MYKVVLPTDRVSIIPVAPGTHVPPDLVSRVARFVAGTYPVDKHPVNTPCLHVQKYRTQEGKLSSKHEWIEINADTLIRHAALSKKRE